MYSTMPHANVPLPDAGVHPKHPFRDVATHQALLDYVQPRLLLGKNDRDARLGRMIRVDKNVSGWMKLTPDEKVAARKSDQTGVPTALTVNLPLNFVQLDDMMTYYSQTFSPNRGMFYQMGKPNEQQASSQIVTIMNNHAIYAGYFRHVLLSVLSILKYNIGGFYGYWAQDTGPKLTVSAEQTTSVESTKIWEGNKVESLDMYNTFWDPTVTPSELYREGEWCARSRIVSHYWLQKKAADGLYFNCKQALDEDTGVTNAVYYRNPPEQASMNNKDGFDVDGGTDWASYLGGTPTYMNNTGFELTDVFIKLNPFQLNLVPQTAKNKSRNRYEIWRLTLLNDKTWIDATPMNNIHGFLPFFFGQLNDDSMGTSQKSAAEIIQPLQDFASFLLNTHVRATRKNIWGLTIYDRSIVDLDQIPEGEVNARVAAKATAAGKDISKAVYHSNNQLDTKQTMSDLSSVMQIIEKFFPTTSMPSQIANIDRAIDSQVAAVQQGANRRMQKGARLLDDTMFRPLRFALYYNIIQFQPDGANITDFYGKAQKIDLSQLRETDLPFIIGQGLKAIDRQAAAGQMQNIIFALIQNPATAQNTDLMGMIDYWTSMIDIDIDMKQFERAPPPTPDQAAGAEGINPITSPQAVTQPLNKTGTDGVGGQGVAP